MAKKNNRNIYLLVVVDAAADAAPSKRIIFFSKEKRIGRVYDQKGCKIWECNAMYYCRTKTVKAPIFSLVPENLTIQSLVVHLTEVLFFLILFHHSYLLYMHNVQCTNSYTHIHIWPVNCQLIPTTLNLYMNFKKRNLMERHNWRRKTTKTTTERHKIHFWPDQTKTDGMGYV